MMSDVTSEQDTVEHSDFETIRRAFAVFNGFDGPSDGLWWRTDDKYAPVTLFVNCNDLFYWGCADCENLGPSSIGDLEKTVEDCRSVNDDKNERCQSFADLLWVARKRQMRPQGAYYKYFPKSLRSLFDACGPERETGDGNPEEPAEAT